MAEQGGGQNRPTARTHCQKGEWRATKAPPTAAVQTFSDLITEEKTRSIRKATPPRPNLNNLPYQPQDYKLSTVENFECEPAIP